jgi:pSer/pThr/pTyr-binding forkhead associated (FHA) protein
VLTLNPENEEAKDFLRKLPELELPSAKLKHDDGTEFTISNDRVVIGRGDEADINLSPWDDNKFCSRFHAELLFEDGEWKLKQNPDATNPTKVNGEKLKGDNAVSLSGGDRITFADIIFQFAQG